MKFPTQNVSHLALAALLVLGLAHTARAETAAEDTEITAELIADTTQEVAIEQTEAVEAPNEQIEASEQVDTAESLAEAPVEALAEGEEFALSSMSLDELSNARGTGETLVITEQSAYMQGNSMNGNFTTGNIAVDNSFNGFNGVGMNVSNTGNQVNINAAILVNVEFQSAPPL